MHFRVSAFACAVIASIVISGCGGGESDAPALHPVSGKLSRGGQPVPNVQITFAPAGQEGRGGTGITDASGMFKIVSPNAGEGVPEGQYKVVLAVAASGSAETDMARYSSGKDPGKAEPVEAFPKEYGSASTSPKTVEVKSGDNEINIEL